MVRKQRQLRPRDTTPRLPAAGNEPDYYGDDGFDDGDGSGDGLDDAADTLDGEAGDPEADDGLDLDDVNASLGALSSRVADAARKATANIRKVGGGGKPAGKIKPRRFKAPDVVSRIPRESAGLVVAVGADAQALGESLKTRSGKPAKRRKRKGEPVVLTPAESRRQQAAFMDSFVGEKRRQMGAGKVFLGKDTKRLNVVIPCPSLAWEFMIAANGFPLGVVLHLLAKWGSGKSGLVGEFMRWFIDAGGWGTIEEVESKYSPSWMESIIGPDYDELINFDKCESLDDWQKKLQYSIKLAQRKMTGTPKEPGLGRTRPFCFAVDSIAGKLAVESQTKIDKEGSAGRGMPAEALSITRYIKSLAGWIDQWPFSVVLVNHLKEKINVEKGVDPRSWSGGSTLGFQETLEIELKKFGSPISTSEADGFYLAMKCYKNSLGVTGRTIFTRVLWWEEEQPEGGFKQKTVFDWDWSTVKLLNHILHGKDPKTVRLKTLLQEHEFHLDCPKVSELENIAWSKSLGMTKDDALPWHEVGRMIREDQDLMRRLRLALRIREYPLLKGDYLDQLSGIAAKME